MKKETKILIAVVVMAVLAISIIVIRYERLLKTQKEELLAASSKVKGGVAVKTYSATEIIDLIKASKEYIGDTITIFEDGKLTTSNPKFQGTIDAVISSEKNMAFVKSNADANSLPLQYNIYTLAATFYRSQYPSEFAAQQ
jgi:hypothetical protein